MRLTSGRGWRLVGLDLDISVDGAEPRRARSSVGQALEIALDEHVRPLETVRGRAAARTDVQVSADSHITLKQTELQLLLRYCGPISDGTK
jgi:hypothetical protein